MVARRMRTEMMVSWTDRRWLEGRFRCDSLARSRKIEALFLKNLPAAEKLRILDVGSGLGANTRYYAERIPRDQAWTLVEKRHALADASLAELGGWAEARGWPWRRSAGGLTIRAGAMRISVRVIRGSMFDLAGEIDLSLFHVLTANGVFDLVTRDQFARLSRALAVHGIPVLATLNYAGTRFRPENAEDRRYLSLYERHMTRPRRIGRAMGSACGPGISGILESLGYSVSLGRSTWVIRRKDRFMLACLIGFMGEALTGSWDGRPDSTRLKSWLALKRDQIERNGLSLSVRHWDVFARPRDTGPIGTSA
jgi:hypothetical protein